MIFPPLHRLPLPVPTTVRLSPLKYTSLQSQNTLSRMNTCLYFAHEMCGLFTDYAPPRVKFWIERLFSLLREDEISFYNEIEGTVEGPPHKLLHLFWLICIFALYQGDVELLLTNFSGSYYNTKDNIADIKTNFWDNIARIDTIPQESTPSSTLSSMEAIIKQEKVEKLRLPSDEEVNWKSFATRHIN